MVSMQRRLFIQGGAVLAGGTAGLPLNSVAENRGRKLRIACVGVGGKGFHDINDMRDEEVVALCDIDEGSMKKALTVFPDARVYTDFRNMFREMGDRIDAVTVSTPDHNHFPIAMMAMQMNKHVYVQKPMAHSIWEVRTMMAEAGKRGLVTQMGNQAHAWETTRMIREWLEAGLIGTVKEVVAWTDRPAKGYGFMPEEMTYPPADPVPENLDWDLWVGPVTDAPPYANGKYHKIHWRGWWKFGMGGLGDIGCHTLDAPFCGLGLEVAHKVEVEVDHVNPIFTPPGSLVKYYCRQKKTGRTIPISWYEGPRLPEKPAGLGEMELPKEGGCMIIGTDGIIYHKGMRPQSPRLFPEEKWQEFRTHPEKRPAKVYPRIKGGHRKEWLRAVKGEGPRPGSNFDYAGPLTEMIVLGTLAIRTGKGLEYDAKKMRILKNPEAAKLLKPAAREGFRPENLRI